MHNITNLLYGLTKVINTSWGVKKARNTDWPIINDRYKQQYHTVPHVTAVTTQYNLNTGLGGDYLLRTAVAAA
jgi:hypothetical protein